MSINALDSAEWRKSVVDTSKVEFFAEKFDIEYMAKISEESATRLAAQAKSMAEIAAFWRQLADEKKSNKSSS